MGPARRLVGLGAGLLVLTASGASAQTARPHAQRQPPPPSKPADAGNTVGNVTDDLDLTPGETARPRTPATATLRPPPPAPPVLRSAVQSRWSQPATIAHSTAGQCRAQCALQRQSCSGGQGDTSGCDPGWTQCLSTCEGIAYRRGP